MGRVENMGQRLHLELSADHRRHLRHASGLLVEPVQARVDDPRQAIRHGDILDIAGRTPVGVLPDYQVAVQQRPDHLLHVKWVALRFGQYQRTHFLGQVFDVQETGD